jgi:hypothetical protein
MNNATLSWFYFENSLVDGSYVVTRLTKNSSWEYLKVSPAKPLILNCELFSQINAKLNTNLNHNRVIKQAFRFLSFNLV